MVLEVSTHNNVKIYTVSGSASAQIPDWLQRKKRKTLQKDIGEQPCICIHNVANKVIRMEDEDRTHSGF